MSTPKYHKDQSVTAEANKLVYADRGEAYGHPLSDYEATAKIWSGILSQPVTPYQAALCMAGVKLSRASRNVGHRDSLVDLAGYAEVANEVHLAEKDQKQPMVVAWDLAKPECKFKLGQTVIVHDMGSENQKYNGKIYKVMGDWGPTCVFVGDNSGERLCFDSKNLNIYTPPKFQVGDYVLLTPEAFKEAAPWITKHGNTNRKVLSVQKASRYSSKHEEYYYVVEADPRTSADGKADSEYLWESWLTLSIPAKPKFQPRQCVKLTHANKWAPKEFVWINKIEPVSPWQTGHSYRVTSCPDGGYVYYVNESQLEAA